MAMDAAGPEDRELILASISQVDRQPDAALSAWMGNWSIDSWHSTGPTYRASRPERRRSWHKNAARALDRGFNAIVGAKPLDDFAEPAVDRLQAWPEAMRARCGWQSGTDVRNAPDMTPVISAAAPAQRRRVAGHRQRPWFHPHRAQPARGDCRRDGVLIVDPVRPAVAVPGADNRPAAAPAGAGGAPRPARPLARGATSLACPRAATKSACSRGLSAT